MARPVDCEDGCDGVDVGVTPAICEDGREGVDAGITCGCFMFVLVHLVRIFLLIVCTYR